jgi:hypothetical protein
VTSVFSRKGVVLRFTRPLPVFLLVFMDSTFIEQAICEERDVMGPVTIGTKANRVFMEALRPIKALVIQVI